MTFLEEGEALKWIFVLKCVEEINDRHSTVRGEIFKIY